MLIKGKWLLCDDAIVRPIIQGRILTGSGSWQEAEFLVDTAADRTAFSAEILAALGLEALENLSALGGIGGVVESVLVETRIQLLDERDVPIVFRGRYAAFTSPDALDMSVLGRDLTNLFAIIVDRPNDVVCLLGQQHRYNITKNAS